MATANNGPSTVSVLFGTGAGSFGAATNFPAHTGPQSVAIGDLNGDGKLDLAVANQPSNDVSVLLGDGAGSFAAATNFPAHTGPSSVAIGDLNGDGKPDLAVADQGTGDVSVLLNAPTADQSPTSLTFGSAGSPVPQGTVSAPQSVAITNNGSAPLVVSGFEISGTNPDDFFTSTDSCHSVIAPAASCSVKVRFAPQAQGSRSGKLTVLTNAPTNPTVDLAGTAGPLPQGPKGDTGATGATGTTGAQGPKGPRGRRGRPGRGAKVTCKITHHEPERIICTVVLAHHKANARVSWSLTRHGHTILHGVSVARHGRLRLRLSDLVHLRPGHYVLHIQGRRHGTTIVIS